LGFPPAARYVVDGWGSPVTALAGQAVDLVHIETGACEGVSRPASDSRHQTRRCPRAARRRLAALGGDPLRRARRRSAPPQERRIRRHRPRRVGCWVERFTAPDSSLAPPGHELVQGHTGLAPGESVEKGVQQTDSLTLRRMAVDGLTGQVEGGRCPPAHVYAVCVCVLGRHGRVFLSS
jgi:hypothetical protein